MSRPGPSGSGGPPQVTLLSLPTELLEKILSYLSYETVSNCRLVCHAFDTTCRRQLNRGFSRAERQVQQVLKCFRSKLPRRESERRNHPLSRRVEHLLAVETRLGLLSMTYRRYMDSDACCFIPGKVLDEIFRVVAYLRETPCVERSSFAVLQELRDISSMAMEHFEEFIAPNIKRTEGRLRPLSIFHLFSPSLVGSSLGDTSDGDGVGGSVPDTPSLGSLFGQRRWAGPSSAGASDTPLRPAGNSQEQLWTKLNAQVKLHGSRLTDQSRTLGEMRAQLNEQAEKLAAQELVITDLTAKLTRLEERLDPASVSTSAEVNPRKRFSPGGTGPDNSTHWNRPSAVKRSRHL